MTTPSFAADTVALWTVVALMLIAIAFLASAIGVRSGRWFLRRRQWRLVPGTGRVGLAPPCPDCGGTAVRVVHGHPTAANILRACVGKLIIVGSVPCPPPWACTACGYRFASPSEVTSLPPPRRPSGRLGSSGRSDGGLAEVVPLFGDGADGRSRERRRQPG